MVFDKSILWIIVRTANPSTSPGYAVDHTRRYNSVGSAGWAEYIQAGATFDARPRNLLAVQYRAWTSTHYAGLPWGYVSKICLFIKNGVTDFIMYKICYCVNALPGHRLRIYVKKELVP